MFKGEIGINVMFLQKSTIAQFTVQNEAVSRKSSFFVSTQIAAQNQFHSQMSVEMSVFFKVLGFHSYFLSPSFSRFRTMKSSESL